MTQGKFLLAALAAAATLIPLGAATKAASTMPSWSSGVILLAGNETEDSAKMGKEEGTHNGQNQGNPTESDTQKIDQPDRRNPTTGSGGNE
jgi:hypothetical protein